jgi:Dullard-like phosphatase family protein
MENKEYHINGLKPRNNFSMEILRNAVGRKNIDKLKKSITSGRIGKTYTTTRSRLTDIRKTKTVENITKVTSFNILSVSSPKIDECQEHEEEDIPIEKYMVGSDDESDSEDDEENNDNVGSIQNDICKDPQSLVDNELTSLLKLCKEFDEPTEKFLNDKAIEFGEKKRHKTLILDMDETLIHAEILPENAKPIKKDVDFTITLKNLNTETGENEIYIVYVSIRPFYDECMENLAKYYELVVFTAAEQDYADAILDVLDTENLIFKRLYRQHCINIEDKYFVKDLRIIKDREIKDMVLVDNSIISMAFNIDNGIPVAPFFRGMKSDEEFLFLHSYLDELYHIDDIRDHNKEKFKLKEIQDGTLQL